MDNDKAAAAAYIFKYLVVFVNFPVHIVVFWSKCFVLSGFETLCEYSPISSINI